MLLRIEDCIKERHELFGTGASKEKLVGAFDAQFRGRIEEGLTAEGGLGVGHKEGGRKTFTGDIAKADRPLSIFHGDEVEIIAADNLCRDVSCDDLVSGNFWKFARKQVGLNLGRQCNLLLHLDICLLFLMQACVIDNLRRLCRDNREESLVIIAERLSVLFVVNRQQAGKF